MKLKYTLVFSIISFFITTAGFSQELSDQEIGFDVTATSLMLKEHGVSDQDLAREITLKREMQLFQYVEMKKVENGILQKIMDEQSAQLSTSHVVNTAKTTFVDIPQIERDALIAFYNSTGGPNWTNTQSNNRVWNITNPSSDVSTWYGVSVSNGHIVSLNLDRNNLKGKLSDLNALTFLNSLSLNGNYNNFVGNAMPSWITTMIGLNVLSIQGYGFTGPMQDLSALVNLQYLDLMDNNFGGGTTTMPSWITGMVSLRNLSLIRCRFIGPLPNLSSLTNLEYLALTGNTFGATMPSWFNTMLSLRYLFLSSCNFTGKIPDLSPLTKLLYLELGNDFTFDIQPMPSWISTMVTLQSLFIIYSNLTGPIADLSRLTNLKFLTLSGNNFNSFIPSELYNLKKLENISLNSCNLKGEISVNIGNLTMLRYLAIYNNNLEGSVPVEFNKLKSLNNLLLQNNKLSGVMPNFTTLPLQQFMINDNKFRFLDFVNEFLAYKIKMPNTNNNPFYYSPQAKINILETITKPSGQSVDLKMYADGDTRFLEDDTYQWFKNGTAITGATSRVYTIQSLSATDAASYICKSYHALNPDMSPLVLEREPITLKVINCTPVTGTLKLSAESPAVNANNTFSLETVATGLTYKWTFYNDASGTTVKDGTQTTAIASQSYSAAGSYLVRLEVTETNGCITKFDKVVNVINNCVDSYSPNRNGMIKSPYPYGDSFGIILNKPTNLSFYSSSGSTSLSYQWNLLDSNNLLVASGNQAIFPITVTNAGDYKVTLRVMDAAGCSSFERDLKTREAAPCVVPVSDRGGYIINPTNSERLLINTATILSLSRAESYNTTGFTYKWDLVKLNGEVVFSGNEENFSVVPTEIGDYKINLEIRDPNGCTTDYTRDYKVVDICVFTEDEKGYVGASDEYNMGATYFVKINESKEFSVWWSYTDISANATYKWSLFNPSGQLISTNTNATFSSVFTIPGYYRVELEITNTITGCKRTATKEVGCLIGNSCTELNPKSAEVKTLVNNLIKSLLIRSIKGETDTQINAITASPEFLALKPYMTKAVGDNIYNYKYSKNIGNDARPYSETIDFSFSPDRLSDIHLDFYWGISEYVNLTDEEILNRLDYDIFIDLSQYVSANDYLISCRIDSGGKNEATAVRPMECRQESEVRYIDFCPTDCIPIEGTLNASTETPIINTSTKFSFGTAAANLTYNWKVTNSANAVVDTVSNTTGLYSFIANTPGNYTISLKVVNEKKCETEFLKTITATAPLPIVDCETHFNFNFKVPFITKGGILNNAERENIADGIISFVNKNISEKLYLTTYDDHGSGVRAVALQNKYTTVFPDATTNTSNETQGGFFRIQDDFYNDTFKNISSGIIANTALTKKIDVSFFVISEDNYADITASKAAYADLLNSSKSNKIFFIFLDEGRFRNRTLNTYISPIEFASQVKGAAAINYAATGNIVTSDFISFSKAQIADEGFKNVLSAFLDKSYTQIKSKKCTTASCVTTNPNSQVVKGLFIGLVNKLQSLPAGTVTNGYTCAELIALTPFITIPNPKIFNYNQGAFSFSNVLNNNDVFMGANAQVTDINLESYADSETETNFIAKYGTTEKGSSVKHINFCPDKLCNSIEGVLAFAPQVLNANVNAAFSLETTAVNLTYDWTFYNLDNATELAKAIIPIAAQSFPAAGRYRVVLNVKDDKGCVTPFETFTTVLPACTPITGVIIMDSGVESTPTPIPTPIPTQSYWYQAVHPLNHTGTDYVIYFDGNGVKQTSTLARTESGDNAPCTEIIASSIYNHTGAVPCHAE